MARSSEWNSMWYMLEFQLDVSFLSFYTICAVFSDNLFSTIIKQCSLPKHMQVAEWNQIFLQVPADSLNLHLCSHCICIQLISALNKHLFGCIYTPDETLRFVYTHVSQNNLSQWPEMYHFLLGQLLHYQKLVADVAQAKVLCALGLGMCVHKYLYKNIYV